jgi:hypothetical protein
MKPPDSWLHSERKSSRQAAVLIIDFDDKPLKNLVADKPLDQHALRLGQRRRGGPENS